MKSILKSEPVKFLTVILTTILLTTLIQCTTSSGNEEADSVSADSTGKSGDEVPEGSTVNQENDTGDQSSDPRELLDKMVLAKIGDSNLTITDLLKMPEIYQLLNTSIIPPKVIVYAAEKAGLTVSDEELEAGIKDYTAGFESIDQYYELSYPEYLPMEVREAHLRNRIYEQKIYIKLVHLKYVDEFGEPSEEEIQERYAKNARYRDLMGHQLGVDPQSLTIDDVRDLIVDEIAMEWMSTRAAEMMDKWSAELGIQNYLEYYGGYGDDIPGQSGE
jgi:hypothetical protein